MVGAREGGSSPVILPDGTTARYPVGQPPVGSLDRRHWVHRYLGAPLEAPASQDPETVLPLLRRQKRCTCTEVTLERLH